MPVLDAEVCPLFIICTMEISCIPDEILLHVFNFLDCLTLYQVTAVCKRWWDIGSVFKKQVHFWMKACYQDIPEDIMMDVTRSITMHQVRKMMQLPNTAFSSEEPSICRWEELYRICTRTNLVGNPKSKEMRHELEVNRPVSCLKINGDFIAVGCYNGTMSLWDHLSGEMVLDTYANYRGVTDLEIISDDDFDNLPIQENKYGLFTRLIVTGGLDRFVTVHLVKLPQFTCDIYWKYECAHRITHVRSWGVYLAVLDALLAGVRILNVKTKTVQYHLRGKQAMPHCIDMWRNKVVCGSTQGDILLWDVGRPSVTDTDVIDIPDTVIRFSDSSRFVDIVFRNKLMICLTGDGFLHVMSTDDHQCSKHSLLDMVHASPRRVCLKGNLLAVGTSAGSCCLYRVRHYDDFKRLNFTAPRTLIHTGANNVRDIDIGDDGDGPLVVLATDRFTVTVIRWYI